MSSDHVSSSEVSVPRDPPSELQYEKWTSDDVKMFLKRNRVDKVSADILKDNNIEGKDLGGLTRQKLHDMNIIKFEIQDQLLQLFSGLCKVKVITLSKVFNDSIHGHIELHPLLIKIINTPQFQRLRDIKQLGGCYFVFPGASHNRFEHSIGVCHLAGQLVEQLRAKQPELGITDKDILCVKMAGLCHDLGHGPFSHLFDGMYMPRVGKKWKHEKGSIDMLDHLIKENELRSTLKEYDINDTDLTFVKEQIVGYPIDANNGKKTGDYEGRETGKEFLYEIVANKTNGIDVDKWDYLARDCHHLGITMSFDYRRFMKFARVIFVKEKCHICTRDKEENELLEMFHTRLLLHKRAYKHKTVRVIELMICEAFVMAKDHVKFVGKNDKEVSLSDCINDMYAYTNLSDYVFHQILSSKDPDQSLKEAQKLLKRILKRDLYKYIGQTKPFSCKKWIEKEQYEKIVQDILKEKPELNDNDFIVDVITFDYGKREENPIDYMRFYSKNDPFNVCTKDKDQDHQFSKLSVPEEFKEQQIRLYCKKSEVNILETAYECFNTWQQHPKYLKENFGVESVEIADSPLRKSRSSGPFDASKARRQLEDKF